MSLGVAFVALFLAVSSVIGGALLVLGAAYMILLVAVLAVNTIQGKYPRR